MSDPLDAVFITGAELMKLRSMIDGYIFLVDSAIKRLSDDPEETLTSATVKAAEERAQLRARIDALENDIVCAFCGTHYKADDVPPQHYLTCEKSPLVQRIAEQARQLAEARNVMTATIAGAGTGHMRAWLAANPATLCTCGMGDATMPELHAKDCALLAPQQDKAQ